MDFDFNKTLPVLPIRNTVIFPGVTIQLLVGRSRSVAALESAREKGGFLYCVTLNEEHDGKEPKADDLYKVGTLAKIEEVSGNTESGYQVVVTGVARVRISEVKDEKKNLSAKGARLNEKLDMDSGVREALLASTKKLAREILEHLPVEVAPIQRRLNEIQDITELLYLCAQNLSVDRHEKQELLQIESVRDRILKLLEWMQKQKEQLRLQNEIRTRVAKKFGEEQKEAFLRSQMDAIREELGEGEEADDADNYRKKIESAGMPEAVKKTALTELRRLEKMGRSSPETHVIRNYLDLLCELPWGKAADSLVDLKKAEGVLDEDHYGLEKIKKRIIQHLAVMKLKKSARGPILLFVGPPGVGKTSLGHSIAKALGRKFVRASLGGVRDDSEIRGHRRTYIGAMPGRIIQGIKRAGENNPVFLLDEIDKLAYGVHGDPAAALLEVLDPEQNSNFQDHYLDVPFDLSKVLFIATANSLETIPGPLLDRMEVIELSGYTLNEKLHIARNHLVPKQLEENGILKSQVEIPDPAISKVVSGYTREAGVRDLSRKLGALCRWTTEKVLNLAEGEKIRVGIESLEDALGPERFLSETTERNPVPGVVTGLAWTPHGGDILFIESKAMNGRGNLILTGQLGDVMKESAQIAVSLVKAHLGSVALGFDFEKKDIHVHVPAGAIPKDGPSAGVTMLTSLASLVSGIPVSPKLAMTGEITLRGAVMPVGGIKEKVIAAHRAGIERIILSRKNARDLKEVPEEIKTSMKFEFVDTVTDLLKNVLGITWSTAPISAVL